MKTKNKKRIEAAEKAVKNYAIMKDGFRATLDYKYCREVYLIDLLADLQHWAEAKNVPFESSLRMARGHFRAETAE